MKATENRVNHYHKVVDCQYACPAHTPVPEYIRLIAAGRYTEAYMVNWESNVFPGILGRVCDRPCEPACRRGRIEGDAEEPVAICRLKRVAADNKDHNREQIACQYKMAASGLSALSGAQIDRPCFHLFHKFLYFSNYLLYCISCANRE